MATSSKGPRASSSKKSSAGKARVVSVKRTEPLPRTVKASAARSKPATQPESGDSRPKTARAAGRASRKSAKAAGVVEPQTTALETPALEVSAIVQTETVVEASQIVEEAAIAEAPIVEAAVVEASVAKAAIVEAPPAPAPHHARGTLMTAVSQLVATLLRWTRVR